MASMMTNDEPMDLDVVKIDHRRYRHINRGPGEFSSFSFNASVKTREVVSVESNVLNSYHSQLNTT